MDEYIGTFSGDAQWRPGFGVTADHHRAVLVIKPITESRADRVMGYADCRNGQLAIFQGQRRSIRVRNFDDFRTQLYSIQWELDVPSFVMRFTEHPVSFIDEVESIGQIVHTVGSDHRQWLDPSIYPALFGRLAHTSNMIAVQMGDEDRLQTGYRCSHSAQSIPTADPVIDQIKRVSRLNRRARLGTTRARQGPASATEENLETIKALRVSHRWVDRIHEGQNQN